MKLLQKKKKTGFGEFPGRWTRGKFGRIHSEKVWSCEVAQSCLTLCNPMDCSLPGSSVHGIFQARLLEWVAISFSSGSSQPKDQNWVSHTADRRFTVWATMYRSSANPWTVLCQAPLSVEFSRQDYWSGLPFPSPKWIDLPPRYNKVNTVIINVIIFRTLFYSDFSWRDYLWSHTHL